MPLVLAKPDKRPARYVRSNGQELVGLGGPIYVEEHGRGTPTIIFTHGWSLDSTVWQYAKENLSDKAKLVMWDLPGMGRSRSAGPISLTHFADELRRLITRNASTGPVVLVGHSIGGMTIQTLAKNHPEMFEKEVAGVILLNTTFTNPLKTILMSRLMLALQKPVIEPAMRITKLLNLFVWLMAWQSYLSGWAHVANRFGFGKFVTRSQLEHVTLLATRNTPANVAQGNLAMLNWDATNAFERLTVPVLVMGGKMDIVTKPEASIKIASSTPRGEVELVDGVNHMGFLEQPELYNTAIADFVAKLPERSAVID